MIPSGIYKILNNHSKFIKFVSEFKQTWNMRINTKIKDIAVH